MARIHSSRSETKISGKLLRPVVVIVLAAFELFSPQEAEATSSGRVCGQEYFIQCGNMSQYDIWLYCSTACPNYITHTCNEDTGGLKCLYDPI